MDKIIGLLKDNKQIFTSAVAVIVTVVIALVFLKIFKKVFGKYKDTSENGIDKEKKTIMRILYSMLKFGIILIVIITILASLGVNISGAVAALGIAGACAALAVQDLLKDLIQGINIVSDKFFSIGDIIEYNGKVGKVLELSMRSTKIQCFDDQGILTVGNHHITEVKKLTGSVGINVPLSYDADRKCVYEILSGTAEKIAKIEDVSECRFLGTNSFASSAINYLIVLKCKPELYLAIRRAALVIIQDDLKEADLQIPYDHLDVTMT